MSHSNPTAGVHRVFLGLLALGFSATSVLAQSTADIYFIHPDHLNTPRVITNNVNQVVWRWDNLDPFGANLPNENPSGLGNFTCNLRLPGQYFDRETKLHYNYFRDYDPSIGRYIESDPIGLRGGINTYAYVYSNPMRYIDPDGLIPQCVPGAACYRTQLPPTDKLPAPLPKDPRYPVPDNKPSADFCARTQSLLQNCQQCCVRIGTTFRDAAYLSPCNIACNDKFVCNPPRRFGGAGPDSLLGVAVAF
jgi:RHS repeat-associated protein